VNAITFAAAGIYDLVSYSLDNGIGS